MSEQSAPSGGSREELARLTYEELVALLEELTRAMGSSEVGIEQAAELYEYANRVHVEAATRLEDVARRIEQSAGPKGAEG